MARTLAQLIARARTHADQVNSRFVTDDEALEMVNDAWGELYGILVGVFEDYFTTEVDIPLVIGTESYDLPDGTEDPVVFKLRGVDLREGANDFLPLETFDWSERVRYSAPTESGTVRITYVPICPRLVSPVIAPAELGISEIDTLPIQVKPRWDEVIALEVAIQMLAKEQNESSHLVEEKKLRIKEILSMAPNRDADRGRRMVIRTAHLDDDDSDGMHRDRFPGPDAPLKYTVMNEQILFRTSGAW